MLNKNILIFCISLIGQSAILTQPVIAMYHLQQNTSHTEGGHHKNELLEKCKKQLNDLRTFPPEAQKHIENEMLQLGELLIQYQVILDSFNCEFSEDEVTVAQQRLKQEIQQRKPQIEREITLLQDQIGKKIEEMLSHLGGPIEEDHTPQQLRQNIIQEIQAQASLERKYPFHEQQLLQLQLQQHPLGEQHPLYRSSQNRFNRQPNNQWLQNILMHQRFKNKK